MFEALRSTFEMFRTQKVRFSLTVSGIVVGVGSLVVMASFLQVGKMVLQQSSTEASGDDIITVRNDWDARMNNPDARILDAADKRNIDESSLLSAETKTTATYGMQDRKATFKGVDYTPFTIGIGDETLPVYNLKVGKGRTFSDSDQAEGRRVVIVGAEALDGKVEPGDQVRVEGRPFLVIGVLERKAEMGPGGPWSWNKRILFPARTYAVNFDPTGRPSNIVVKVGLPPEMTGLMKDYVLATRTVVDTILMQNRTVKSYEIEAVSDDSSTEALILQVIEGLLYLTTVFSMIVGGINIMNIMLVTVTERTREIGLRRAVGATQGAILRQFLAETLAITMVGAGIGLGGALAILAVGSLAMTKWVAQWPFHVEPWSVFLGLLFSCGIGLTFGLYPAWRASRLDPVDALRFE
jgi:putative ABC transport system permease protein